MQCMLVVLYRRFGTTNQAQRGPWTPHLEVSRSHTTTQQSVRLVWTRNQCLAETSTGQHTTLTIDRHPCHLWDSNPQCQQASGRKPTPYTTGPLEPANGINTLKNKHNKIKRINKWQQINVLKIIKYLKKIVK